MDSNSITFSVVTPVYNGQNYIANCIESVINANYNLKHIEHIVVDDGSTDNTAKIVKEYASKYPHIKYFHKKNGNWGSVINFVKHNKLVKNNYILILDADDKIRKNIFNVGAKKTNNIDILLCSYYVKMKISIYTVPYLYIFKRTLTKEHNLKFPYPCMGHFCSMFIKKNLFYSIPDLEEKVYYQDSILKLDLLEKAQKIKWSNKAVAKYEVLRDGNSMSKRLQTEEIAKQVKMWKRFIADGSFDFVFYSIFSYKKIKKYLKDNNILFKTKVKPKLEWTPWWLKIILFPQWKTFCKNFIKKID